MHTEQADLAGLQGRRRCRFARLSHDEETSPCTSGTRFVLRLLREHCSSAPSVKQTVHPKTTGEKIKIACITILFVPGTAILGNGWRTYDTYPCRVKEPVKHGV